MVGLRKDLQSGYKIKLLTVNSWISVVLTVTLTCLQQASAQKGWLSIDCGAPAPYVDVKGISWVPDAAYISVGSSATVTLDPALPAAQGNELTTLRYFPDTTRTRYCYVLPAKIGETYLLRVKFYHGGYDKRPAVRFDFGLDCYVIGTYALSVQYSYFTGEAILQARNDDIQLCLFRTSPTDTPFISSLEMRPLEKTMYAKVQDGSALILQHRVNYGAVTQSLLRYPVDSFDREWTGNKHPEELNNLAVDMVTGPGLAADKPPRGVMNTAITAKAGWGLTFYPNFINGTFLINLYFAELEPSIRAETRVFNILLNEQLRVENLNVFATAQNMRYKPIEVIVSANITSGSPLIVNFTRGTTASFLGPIINAVELFSTFSTNKPRTLAADATAIESVKKSFGLLSWTGDPCLLLPYDWLLCAKSSPPRVTTVNLSNSNLTGFIPVGLRDLTNLTSLHLENNKLTGQIPDWLASLPNLRELYLQNNDLSGNVPEGLLNSTLLKFQFEGNPRLCVNATCPTDGNSSNVGIIVGVVVGVVAVLIAAGSVILYKKNKKKQDTIQKMPSTVIGDMEGGEGTRGCSYTLAQVIAATNNYERVLGQGGFGPVFYGKLAIGQEVAVKVAAKDSGQGSKEFINEIELLTRVHHKNLVSLVGYCNEGDNLTLIYEFMPKGTLQEHLYGDYSTASFLDWSTRLQIALAAAQGLEYLHEGCSPAIFHRDVKSNNILLSGKMVAKVADFGLSKSTSATESVTHVSTVVKGTIGYLDPEYFLTSQLTDKSDVYGFGIVLLEVICGRAPCNNSLPEHQRRIDQWVRNHLQAGTLEQVVDPALAGQYDMDSMWKVADLAMASVEPKSMHRPRMSTIVQGLRDAIQVHQSAARNSSSSIPRSRPRPRPRPRPGSNFSSASNFSSSTFNTQPSSESSS